MRFLFGLLVGALATLFVATAFDAPVDGLQKKVLSAWKQVKSMAAPDSLEPSPVQEEDEFRPLNESLDSDAEAQANLLAQTSVPDAQTAEEPGPPEPETSSPEQISDRVAETPFGNDQEIEAVVEPLAKPDSAAPLENAELPTYSTLADLTREEEVATKGEGIVWSPFHSEASAEGFARRLSDQLDRRFDVRKQGPAQYLVVYDYASELERANIESQIALATGQQ